MFLGKGATRFALNPVQSKADPQALEDERCSLIGNSFHAGVFALVFSGLFEEKRMLRRPSPQELVNRMGLRPGELYLEGLDCRLDRPKGFHRLDDQRRGHVFPSLGPSG